MYVVQILPRDGCHKDQWADVGLGIRSLDDAIHVRDTIRNPSKGKRIVRVIKGRREVVIDEHYKLVS